MKQIICPVCNNPNPFPLPEYRPSECSFCFTQFDASIVTLDVDQESGKNQIGLNLIYQENNESIMVNAAGCILGREHTGARVLSDIMVNGIPVISRKHCSIILTNGKYVIKDEGSSNGTFYGVNKIDCAVEPQIIESNSLIFLGREAFLVQFIYEDPLDQISEKDKNEDNAVKKTKQYRCNEGCGYESETYVEICPKCYTIHSLIEIG